MRTTLTIDDDLARGLERLQREESLTFKATVNHVLRLGLRAVDEQTASDGTEDFETAVWHSGRCLIGSVTDVAEALAIGEGDGFR